MDRTLASEEERKIVRLIALLDHTLENHAQRGVYRYLKCVAQFGGLPFFANGRDEDFDEEHRNGALGLVVPGVLELMKTVG